jgi:hypothetical protein
LAIVGLATATGPSSGGSLNPARSLGPAAVAGEGDDLWIWVIGPIIGAPLQVLRLNALPIPETKDSAQIRNALPVTLTFAKDKFSRSFG